MGRASATELKRALVDADNMRDVEIKVVDEVANQCGVWMVLDQAPHVSIAGTSAVSAFNEKVLVDLFFLGDVNPVRALDPFLKYSLLARGSLQRPPEVRGALAAPRIIVCGKTRCVRMEEREVGIFCLLVVTSVFNSKEKGRDCGCWKGAVVWPESCLVASRQSVALRTAQS